MCSTTLALQKKTKMYIRVENSARVWRGNFVFLCVLKSTVLCLATILSVQGPLANHHSQGFCLATILSSGESSLLVRNPVHWLIKTDIRQQSLSNYHPLHSGTRSFLFGETYMKAADRVLRHIELKITRPLFDVSSDQNQCTQQRPAPWQKTRGKWQLALMHSSRSDFDSLIQYLLKETVHL